MKNSVYDELIRLSLRRHLTAEDRLRIEAAVAAHPELKKDWESDAALGRLLRELPDAPVSSNFTALVVDAIEREERVTVRSRTSRFRWPQWVRPRAATVFGFVVVIAFAAHQYRDRQDRSELAQDIRRVSQEFATLPSLPGPEIFHDFEAIDRLRQVSVVSDDELLKVLQQ